MTPLIAILTDFGYEGAYTGIMKGVIAGIAPETGFIDLTQAIPPGDIRRGAFELWQSYPYFKRPTIFLGVIDPGVGTDRRPIAIEWSDHFFVGPDNGLGTYLLVSQPPIKVVELMSTLSGPQGVSHTFHGRDIFAPSAARLALGAHIEELGSMIQDPQLLPLPRMERIRESLLVGEVQHADPYGNLVTSIGTLSLEEGRLKVEPWLFQLPAFDLPLDNTLLKLPDGSTLSLQSSFGSVPVGQALAYIGSSGLLEIAVNQGRADDLLGLKPGQEVQLVT